MRASKEIRIELNDAEAEHIALGKRVNALRKELDAAMVEEANATANPWVGKTVTKSVRHGYRGGRINRSGTVTIYDPAKHRGLRGLYRTGPGDLFVLSASGITGYPWKDYSENEPSWVEK